jgi:site-specific DNA-adenine methylase
MPVPYMGSKRRSAGKIYQTIVNLSPEFDTICDLFCGGGAISEIFIKKGFKVIANDKNKYVVALLDQVINKKLDEKKCLEWVSREKFKDVQLNPNNYEDWYVGYVQCIWSFGNNQKTYMFGKEVEPCKKAAHELVVNCDETLIKQFFNHPSGKDLEIMKKEKTVHLRQMTFIKIMRKLGNTIEGPKQLQQLEQLERLERLEQLERLEFYSDDYKNIIIPDNAVIYCDPPYKGTAEYKEGGFDHDKFWDWVREKSKIHKVYISEYTAPDDFVKVLEFSQKSNLQGGTQSHNNQPNECLFTIKK